jgi:tetratricopeptide (TPR) repeat protein
MGLVELDPKIQISLLEPVAGDFVEVVKKLKTLGFQNLVVESDIKGIFERYSTRPPAVLLLFGHREISLCLEIVRDLKSAQDMPNFPILPIVKKEDFESFSATAAKYGVQEIILHPVHPQTLMEALARAVNRFDVSHEEKGISRAKVALGNGDSQTAIAALQGVRTAAKSIRTELGIGQAFLMTDAKEKSLEYLESAKVFDAENFQIRLAELEKMVAEGAVFDVLMALIEGMAPQLKEAHRIAQVLKIFVRQKSSAMGLLVLEKYGNKWEQLNRKAVRLAWARMHHAEGQPDEALLLLLNSIKDKEAGVEVFNLLGVIYSQREEWELSKNYYAEALKVSPGDYRLIFNIALIWERQGDLEQAQKFYKACLSVAPAFEKAAQRLNSIKSPDGEKP